MPEYLKIYLLWEKAHKHIEITDYRISKLLSTCHEYQNLQRQLQVQLIELQL